MKMMMVEFVFDITGLNIISGKKYRDKKKLIRNSNSISFSHYSQSDWEHNFETRERVGESNSID